MSSNLKYVLSWLALSAFALSAQASNEVEGAIAALDSEAQTVEVEGITFHVDERTDYDDSLRGFSDLSVGQRVEVEFKYVDGRHVATEIELDD
jgi:hypothetical protein